MSLLPLQLFKTSPMKLGWGSYCCSRRVESCACAISVRRSPSPSPRSPAIWRCSVRADCCWIVNRVSGSITASPQMPAWAAQVIEQAPAQSAGGCAADDQQTGWRAGLPVKIYLNIYDFSNVIGGGTMLLAGTIFILTLGAGDLAAAGVRGSAGARHLARRWRWPPVAYR